MPSTLKADDAFGFTPYDRNACRDRIAALRSEGLYTPPSTQGSVLFPFTGGGVNWGGVAIDPGGVVYVNTSRAAHVVTLIPRADFDRVRAQNPGNEVIPQRGTAFGMQREMLASPFGAPCNRPPWGTLAALDLRSKRILWQQALGTTEDLSPIGIALKTGTPNFGGPVATAGGVIFIGAAMDRYLRAFDAASGEELWRGRLPAAGMATPMTYAWHRSSSCSCSAPGLRGAGVGDDGRPWRRCNNFTPSAAVPRESSVITHFREERMNPSNTLNAATAARHAGRLWPSIVVAASAWFASHSAGAVGAMVDVDVIDRDSGATLQVFPYKGSHYVAGRPGARYAIRVSNQTGGRVLAVMSVDGVNIVTGQTASWNQSGYVLEPWQSHEITGWRKSQQTVAAFEFTALPDSYAARTGRPGDVGVIGVAVFAERPAPPPPVPWTAPEVSRSNGQSDGRSNNRSDDRNDSVDRRESAAGANAEKAAPSSAPTPTAPAPTQDSARSEARRSQGEASPKLGTGHGAREASYAGRTTFVRSSTQPLELVSIQYDRHQNLVLAGIIPDTRPTPPSPFPRSAAGRGYVPDPPNW